MDKKEEQMPATKIFVVKTTTGQERNVARLIAAKVDMTHIPIKALLVPDTLKGYVFIEAEGPHLSGGSYCRCTSCTLQNSRLGQFQ